MDGIPIPVWVTIVVPLAAAIVGAIVVAIVQPVWTRFVGRTGYLNVSVDFSENHLPQFLSQAIDYYLSDYNNRRRLADSYIEKLRRIRHCDGYTRIYIENVSKSTIKGTTLRLKDNPELIFGVSADKELKTSGYGRLVTIGDLPPNMRFTIELWTLNSYADRWSADKWRDRIAISADAYEKIKYKLSVPPHIGVLYFLFSKTLVKRTFWTLYIIFMIAQVASILGYIP